MMKKLDHPYIIKIIEYYLEKSDLLIIMEYCSGKRLNEANMLT